MDESNLNEAELVYVPVIEEEEDMVEQGFEDVNDEDIIVQVKDPYTTPRPSLYVHTESPGGSFYWEPDVEDCLLPLEGKCFDTLERCIDFYNIYAEKGGFEVKKSAQKKTQSGCVSSKYIMCNREGVPKGIYYNSLDDKDCDKQIRNTRHRITGCMARIKIDLDIVTGTYRITKFVAKHNHPMLPKEYTHLTKKQRKMAQAEKLFVVKASTMRIGATKAHSLYSKIKGGRQYVHGTSDDFKNHMRDINAFIGESDAQMLINKMLNRKTFVPRFTFQYLIENSELVAFFWADEVDKCNYQEFGDVISFDATFRTNKYDMVFVPFTGIDNHRKSVTVGAGMLLREDTEAYTWLLMAFMTAHKKQPSMIVTDQDGAMKNAIEKVFTESKHRLCMWHVMQKVPAKICKEIYEETDFKDRLNKLVWNMFLEPTEFEEKWSKLVEEFGLQNNKWMTKMFKLREMWLPAYFINSPMFGLMRTTSRSESENAFFKNFTNHGSTLVNFLMCFESAMERQRYRQEVLDFRTFDAAPKLQTKLQIERHAYKIYTRSIFLLVQTEIVESMYSCQIEEFKTEDGVEKLKVKDNKAGAYKTLYSEKGKDNVVQEKDKVAQYLVLRSLDDGSVECTCRHFIRYGFLCKHVFCFLKNRGIEMIPEKYILRRWRRDLIPPSLRRNTNRYGEKNENIERLNNEANSIVDECLFLLRKDESKLATFVEELKSKKDQIRNQIPKPASQKTIDVIEEIYAVEKPSDIEVKNLQKAKNKGFNRAERRKSGKEIALKAKNKKARKCLFCGVKTNTHSKKTCPENPKYIAKLTKMAAAADKGKEPSSKDVAANQV